MVDRQHGGAERGERRERLAVEAGVVVGAVAVATEHRHELRLAVEHDERGLPLGGVGEHGEVGGRLGDHRQPEARGVGESRGIEAVAAHHAHEAVQRVEAVEVGVDEQHAAVVAQLVDHHRERRKGLADARLADDRMHLAGIEHPREVGEDAADARRGRLVAALEERGDVDVAVGIVRRSRGFLAGLSVESAAGFLPRPRLAHVLLDALFVVVAGGDDRGEGEAVDERPVDLRGALAAAGLRERRSLDRLLESAAGVVELVGASREVCADESGRALGGAVIGASSRAARCGDHALEVARERRAKGRGRWGVARRHRRPFSRFSRSFSRA